LSSICSDVEPVDIDSGDQSDAEGRNPWVSLPDAIVVSSDSSDVENVDDGYGSDDLMSEMDGEELRESLQMQMEGEIEILKQSEGSKKSSAYRTLMREITPNQWAKAESNKSLGYNGRSKRTKQRNDLKTRQAEEEHMKIRAL
jgi:hypothetical protein